MVDCERDDLGSCCGMCNYKVIACIPVFGRLPLLRYTIERLYKRNGVYKVICSGDNTNDRALCESLGAAWVHHRNRPLGQKWNAAFQEAKQFNPDSCLFVGSSDWLSDNWLKEMRPYSDKYDIIGTSGCHFIHLSTQKRLCYWPGYIGHRENESIGIGRMINSNMLDKMQWQPFNNELNESLDYSMMQKCSKLAGNSHLVSTRQIKSMSISTDLWPNKHKFEQHWSGELPSERIDDVEKFVSENFPEINKIF
jgi:hypothetical protein